MEEPLLNELLSPAPPWTAPPTVIPGNSGTTGGISPNGSVASSSASIGTFGSTTATRRSRSTCRTRSSPLASIIASRRNSCARVELVDPW